jgi:hypothetical protein
VAYTNLQNELEEVRGKQSVVVETKCSIVKQLDDIQHLIEKRKCNWEQKQAEDISAVATAAKNELKTGFLLALHDLLIYYPNVTIQTIIFLYSIDPILQVSLIMVVTCHIVLYVSHCRCNFVLSMLQYIVQLTMM